MGGGAPLIPPASTSAPLTTYTFQPRPTYGWGALSKQSPASEMTADKFPPIHSPSPPLIFHRHWVYSNNGESESESNAVCTFTLEWEGQAQMQQVTRCSSSGVSCKPSHCST